MPNPQLNIFNQDSETEDIYLYGGVGKEDRIDGDLIAERIRECERRGIKKIRQHINSGGGSVFNGLSIVSANLNSKCEILTYNDGIAASMSGIIWLTGDKTFMEDYAQLMIHEPSIGNETIETTTDEKIKNGLTAIRDTLSKIIQNRTGKSKDEVNQIMNAQTWYSARQAVRAGFLPSENIIQSSKRPKVPANATTGEILESVTNFYKQNNNDMDEKIKAIFPNVDDKDIPNKITLLKSDADKLVTVTSDLAKANDELTKVRGKIDEKTTKITELENSITEKDGKITALETSLKSKEDKIIDVILDHAIESGKIKAAEKEAWKTQFKDDSDKLIFALEKTITKAPKITDNIYDGTKISNDRENWGFKEWSKKDPKGLEKIKDANLKLYNELGVKSYGDKWTEIK